MVVEQGYLPHVFRESHGQLTAWVHVAEQHVANGIGRFAATEPYVQDGGHMFLLPGERQRPAGEEG